MLTRKLYLSILAALFVLSGLVLAQEDADVIDDLRQQYADTYNAGDVDGIVGLYTEDAIVYDASGDVQEGTQAIREWTQGNIDAGFTQLSSETIQTEDMDGTAYHIGSYTLTNDDGSTLDGYYMVILTRENDEWRIHRFILNTMMPEQETDGEDTNTSN